MSHPKWICRSEVRIELRMVTVAALSIALLVSCGVQSPSSVNGLKYNEDREVLYCPGYVQIKGLEQCTSLD